MTRPLVTLITFLKIRTNCDNILFILSVFASWIISTNQTDGLIELRYQNKDHLGREKEDVTMFAPESPEVLFTDCGVGSLKKGEAYIELDPILTKNIHVSESNPLRVFVQLEGECNGVYVTKKTSRT